MEGLKIWANAHFSYAHRFRVNRDFTNEYMALECGVQCLNNLMSSTKDNEDEQKLGSIKKMLYERRIIDVKKLMKIKSEKSDIEILETDANGQIIQRILIEKPKRGEVTLIGMDDIKIPLLGITKAVTRQGQIMNGYAANLTKTCVLLFGVPGLLLFKLLLHFHAM
jgi:hypothetical protein